MTAPGVGWRAWYRPGGKGRWLPGPEGATERQAWCRLHDLLDTARRPTCDVLVLPAGRRP